MATGGDDLPVLALLLLSLVLLSEGRTTASGAAQGAALALKQTALLLLPFLLLAVPRGRRAKALGAAALVAVPVSAALAAWNLPAFVEDAVKFPLGLGRERSAAGSVTVGSLLVRAFPGGQTALSLVLAVAVLAVGAVLIVRRPPRDASGAAAAAAVVSAFALLLAPQARAGYVIYPIDLAVWAVALRSVHSVPERTGAP
jgi:hypothetical protein